MSTSPWYRMLPLIAVLLALLGGCAHGPADLVLLGGKIVTMDPRQPRVQALAARGELVVALGSDAQVRPHIGPRTQVIQLAGKLAIPGFIEGHGHFLDLGESKMTLDLRAARSWTEVLSMVRAAVKKARPGEWIVGTGWHQEKWVRAPSPAHKGLPLHHLLSQLSPRNPVLLDHASGHTCMVNARAMALAGIKAGTPNPAGGEIVRDRSGQATGIFSETARGLITRVLKQLQARRSPAQVEAELRQAVLQATRECLSHGVTSFQDAGASFARIDLFRKLADQGQLGLRLWVMLDADNNKLARRIGEYRIIGHGNNRLTVRAIKRYIDGALGSHGAWLLAPYTDQPNKAGLNATPVAQLERAAELAIKHGFQLCTHAIGDRGNREVLDLYQRAFARHPQQRDLRWRIEHAQHLHPADIPRFAQLGVIAAMQGVHCTSDGPWVVKRLGPRRASQGAYAWRRLLDSGAVIANGTDTPVERLDPLAGYHALVTRRMASGVAFFPEQRMTRVEALRSYTIDAARAAFEERIKGSLEPGKLADIAVLSRDILTVPPHEIRQTRVLYTILGGKVVYQASGPSPAATPASSRPAPLDDTFLAQYAATYRFRLGRPKRIKLSPDGEAVLFLRSGPRSFVHDLYALDSTTGKERVLLTARQLLGGGSEALSAEERARRERMRMAASRGIASYSLSRDGQQVLVPLSGRLFVLDRRRGSSRELRSTAKAPPLDPRFSPDGKQVACVRAGELYVQEIASGRQRRLTRGAGTDLTNGLAEFVAQEEMRRYRGYWWSPDSRQLVYQQTDTTGVERRQIVDPARPQRPARSTAYPRPGRRNARVRLGVIAARGGETRWLQWDRKKYPYLTNVKWPRRGPLTLVVQDRKQSELVVLRADPRSGRTTPLLSERDDKWINIDDQMPRWLEDGSAFLWTTERAGAWQLELRDAGGKLRHAVTAPSLGYRRLLDVDAERGELFVLASHTQPEAHIYRVPLSGKGPARRVTRRQGLHSAVFSRDHKSYVHTVAPLQGAHSATLRGLDGRARGSLRHVSETPAFVPNLQLLTVGRERLHAALVRPRDFDARRRYPVVVYVYGGPHVVTVRASWQRYLIQQWIADHGFVVVSLDGRGTPYRGRAWERALRGDLARAPLQDQIAGLQALGRRFPYLDLSRVGIYGWSFGGHMAAVAVLQRPDVYHAAVAAAPVTDWLDYDTHYTERYLGLPASNAAGYASSSALTFAHKLTRPLLLVHGTTDDNVYFSHSIKLSSALFKARKRHDFLPLSGTHLLHHPKTTQALFHRIVEHFDKHLR